MPECECGNQKKHGLKKMIERESKNARLRFERFDLDGNIEEREKSKK